MGGGRQGIKFGLKLSLSPPLVLSTSRPDSHLWYESVVILAKMVLTVDLLTPYGITFILFLLAKEL